MEIFFVLKKNQHKATVRKKLEEYLNNNNIHTYEFIDVFVFKGTTSLVYNIDSSIVPKLSIITENLSQFILQSYAGFKLYLIYERHAINGKEIHQNVTNFCLKHKLNLLQCVASWSKDGFIAYSCAIDGFYIKNFKNTHGNLAIYMAKELNVCTIDFY